MDNTRTIESVQHFLVDSRPLGKYDPSRNYGEPEADRYFPPMRVTWVSEAAPAEQVMSFDANGEACGFVRFKQDGTASGSQAGALLASEVGVALLRGDAWGAAWDAPERFVTVCLGARDFLALAGREDNRDAAILGFSRLDAAAREVLRTKVPEDWAICLFGAAKAVCQ